MNEFKIGDRVTVVNTGHKKYLGRTGTIITIGNRPYVQFNRNKVPFLEHNLMLITKESGLTLKEAIESGRRFRQKGNTFWINKEYRPTQTDAIAEDYELEPIKEGKRYTLDEIKELLNDNKGKILDEIFKK